jgi:hypothetical protein
MPPYLGSGHPLQAFVHDRAYATSALMAVALAKAFPKLLQEQSNLEDTSASPLKLSLFGVKCDQDSATVADWFTVLGYETSVLDVNPPSDHGNSRLVDIHLEGAQELSMVLRHLQALLCALDQDHVHWIGKEETLNIVNAAQPWLQQHPAFAGIQAAMLQMPNTAKRNSRDNLVEANEDFSLPTPRNLYRNSTENEVFNETLTGIIRKEKGTAVLVWFPESAELAISLCQLEAVQRLSLMDLQPDFLQGIVPKLNAANISPDLKRKLQLQIGSPIYHGEFIVGFDTLVLEGMLGKLPQHQWPAMASTLFAHAKPKIVFVVEPMGKELKAWVDTVTKEYPFEAEFLIPKISEAPKAVPMAIVIFKHSPNK